MFKCLLLGLSHCIRVTGRGPGLVADACRLGVPSGLASQRPPACPASDDKLYHPPAARQGPGWKAEAHGGGPELSGACLGNW